MPPRNAIGTARRTAKKTSVLTEIDSAETMLAVMASKSQVRRRAGRGGGVIATRVAMIIGLRLHS